MQEHGSDPVNRTERRKAAKSLRGVRGGKRSQTFKARPASIHTHVTPVDNQGHRLTTYQMRPVVPGDMRRGEITARPVRVYLPRILRQNCPQVLDAWRERADAREARRLEQIERSTAKMAAARPRIPAPRKPSRLLTIANYIRGKGRPTPRRADVRLARYGDAR